jgi:hypothetical protein
MQIQSRLNFESETEPIDLACLARSFGLTLSDGSEVQVEFSYIVPSMPHFAFRGDSISTTGYRSCFPRYGICASSTEDEIKSIALQCAEMILLAHLAEIKKSKQKRSKR